MHEASVGSPEKVPTAQAVQVVEDLLKEPGWQVKAAAIPVVGQ